MIFYEEGHIYESDGKQFSSVSSVLKSLEKTKNWKTIAKNYAKKVGKTPAEVEAMWKEKNDKAIERGHAYHTQKQQQLNSAGFVQRKNVECLVKFHSPSDWEGGKRIVQPDVRLENSTIYTEFMIWDEESGICGTADEVEVIRDTINVNDHKTNEEIKREGFYIPNVGREKLLSPVAHLDDCNWNKYCLQLSSYIYMLWKKNKHLKVGKLTLNHVDFEDDKPTKVTQMDVPYLRDEVRAIFDWWKTRK